MGIESRTLKFSGHQTFPLRYGWLYKIIQEILAGSSISSIDNIEEQMISMGVGKNMVLSIRHWIKTIGLVTCSNEGVTQLTPLAKALFVSQPNQKPLDEFMDNIGTVWILHWVAQSFSNLNNELNTARWFFNYFNGVRTDKIQLERDINLSLANHDKKLNSSTLKKDIDCFYQTYAMRDVASKKSNVEESFNSPFNELGLLIQIDSKHYMSELSDRKSLPNEIFVYALIDYIKKMQVDKNSNMTFSFENLLTGVNSPGRIFRLSSSGLSEKLDAAEQITNGKLAWTDTQGLRQLQNHFDDIHAIDPIYFIEPYYQR